MEPMNDVTTAQSSENFDVLSFLDNTAYPTKTVVVYTDAAGAAEYVDVVRKRAAAETGKNSKSDEELTAKIEALGERISKSALIFTLQGLAPSRVQEVLKPVVKAKANMTQEEEEAEDARQTLALVTESVTKISNSAGVVDPNPVSVGTVEKIRDKLTSGEFSKLVKAVSEVNFTAALFTEATDAGFSGRSSDLAL